MKIAFIISSAIDIDDYKNLNFINKKSRTAFSAVERFDQTRFTLENINSIFPDCKKYIFDVSKNYQKYEEQLSYIKNLNFISIEKINSKEAERCRSLKSKGWCESISTSLFLDLKKEELKQYDFIIKITGRYFYTKFNKNFLIQKNLDKILCKKIIKWEWNDNWNFPNFLKKDNMLYWMPTNTYCISNKCIEEYADSIENIKSFYSSQNSIFIDFECLMFNFLIKEKNFIETDWKCAGLGGEDGKYNEY